LTPDREFVDRVVRDALALHEDERDAFIRSSCGDSAVLVLEVLSKLRSAELSTSQMERSRAEKTAAEEGDSAGTVAPQVGSRFGDLTLESKLGAGQQGAVFSAYQGKLDRHVAVKILTAGDGLSSDQADRFRREAEAAGRLNHPNIVAIHEILERNGSLLIVQELVEGRTLEEIMDEREKQPGTVGGTECQWAATVCMHIARGLQHAHEHQVIHRDVKPANVLVTNDGVPKLTDFGLALMQDRFGLTQTGTLLGTPKYMAPEQVESSNQALDARTDVYALGAILYRMLTGRVPFMARTMQALFRDILTREPKSPRSMHLAVPRDLEAVCLKCLEKDKDGRYDDAGALADDLQNYLSRQPTAARPVGLIGSTDRALRRLAVSTLLAVSLLFPVVWFALDKTWLAPWAERDLGVHNARLGVLAFFLLATIWPVARLFRRLAHGRQVVTAISLSIVLLAGSAGFWSVHEDSQQQQHALARRALEVQLSQVPDQRVDALELYAAGWANRFGPRDWQLMARGYLLAKRAPLAQHWVDRLMEEDPDNPVSMAFAYVLQDLFGSSNAADEAKQRLWESSNKESDWGVWQRVGQILRDTRRFDLAQQAYEIALSDKNMRIHDLSPDLAQVSLDLCQYDRAKSELRLTMSAIPDDVALQWRLFHISCRAAIGLGEWQVAEEHLERFESLPGVFRTAVLDLRYELLASQGRSTEAAALVTDLASGAETSFNELLWCGAKADTLAEAATSLEAFRGALTLMQDCFERVLEAQPDSVEAHVSLAGALIQRATRAPDGPDEQRALLERAEILSGWAINLDDNYFKAYSNLAFARRELARMDYGNEFKNIPTKTLHRFLDPMRKALERDSLSPEVLNDTAFGLALLYEQERDPALLTAALDNIRRSIRLRKGSEASACAKWPYLNYLYNTQRRIQKLAGDLPAALVSATLAVAAAEAVVADAERMAVLREHVERLQREIEAADAASEAADESR